MSILNSHGTWFDFLRRKRILGYLQLSAGILILIVLMHLADLGYLVKVSPLFYSCIIGLSGTTVLFNIFFPGYLRATKTHNFQYAWMFIEHRDSRKYFCCARLLGILAAGLLFYFDSIEQWLIALGLLSLNLTILYTLGNLIAFASMCVCIYMLIKEMVAYREHCRGTLYSHQRYYAIWFNALKMIEFDPRYYEEY